MELSEASKEARIGANFAAYSLGDERAKLISVKTADSMREDGADGAFFQSVSNSAWAAAGIVFSAATVAGDIVDGADPIRTANNEAAQKKHNHSRLFNFKRCISKSYDDGITHNYILV